MLAIMAAVVGMMPSLLQVSSAAEATGVAVANSITGSVTGKGTAFNVADQALSVTTTLSADAHAGDYVEYSFRNVSTDTLNGTKLLNASGQEIGTLSVFGLDTPEVKKQNSLNPELQSDTELGTSWVAKARAIFSGDVPSGTSFTFSSKKRSQPVVFANTEYTLEASVTTVHGEGSVGTTFTIPPFPVEKNPLVRLNGTMTFTAPTVVQTTNQLTVVPKKDLQVGDELTVTLSEKSGLTFLRDELMKTGPTTVQPQNRNQKVAPQRVNAQGAYIIQNISAQLEIVNATDTSVTVRVMSGSIPAMYGFNVNLGNNVVDVTRNNLNAQKDKFSVFETSQTDSGADTGAQNPEYKVVNAQIADLSSLDITEFYDEAGREIQPSVYSNTNPSRDIAGYHLMRETPASPNAGTRLIYHRMMTRFVDHTKTDIPGADPVVGTDAPQKDIDGYRYVDKETAANGDVLYVYHKLEEREETKEITRTITYLDATTKGSVHAPEVQKVTLTRTNTWDTVTNTVVKEGAWSEASWPEVKSPSVENYKPASKTSVPEAQVMGTTADTTVEVTYEQDTEDVPESKTVTRTIHYVDATSGETVAPDEAQPATISRTNVRNKVTNDVTEGAWSEASWAAVKSPDVKNYVNPDTPTVEAVSITPETQNAEVTVRYQQGTEDVPDSKTVTRTIHYVDATSGETVAPDEVQAVTLTRTNVKNLVTGVVTEGTWSSAKFEAVQSPSVTKYDAPDKPSVPEADATEDKTETVSYPQHVEDVPESKTVTRTIHYVDATSGETVAPDKVQTVTLTRTNKHNLVTDKVAEGAWSTGKWEAVTSPEVKNYGTPDTASFAEMNVTAETANAEETVHYPQGTVNIPEEKTITRTISYVDATRGETVAPDKVQTVTLTRTNVRNLVTNVLTEGEWSTGKFDAVAFPAVENYDAPDPASAPELNVTSTTENSEIKVQYKQSTEEVPEEKTVTRTITYVDAVDGKEIALRVPQTATLKRTNIRNLVTKAVTEGTWSTAKWDEVVSPKVDNYKDPDKASVPEAEATADSEVTVKYPQGTQNIPEEKTVTRTISFVDATDPKTAVANPVIQTAKLTRTNVKNLVTGALAEGTWSTAKFAALAAPSVENYDTPEMTTVEAMDVTGDTADNTDVTVSYPQGTEEVPEEKTVTRTLTFTDETGKQIADPLIQTVTLKRVNVRNKVTGVITEGTWSAAKFPAAAVPEVAGYTAPSISTIPEADATGNDADEPLHITYTTVRTQVKTKQGEAQQAERKNARALARTGADQSGLFTTALALLVVGLAGVTMARRRRAQ
ncbi:mucin-binding protein [Alloscardovia macacae]|uniref:mucin-binding protein n=1 Tax=Alloscardovia macacae TaxID=1160091 RepID=UPI001314BF63|nr:hypothetical protein [Alloscardovia macacae]